MAQIFAMVVVGEERKSGMILFIVDYVAPGSCDME